MLVVRFPFATGERMSIPCITRIRNQCVAGNTILNRCVSWFSAIRILTFEKSPPSKLLGASFPRWCSRFIGSVAFVLCVGVDGAKGASPLLEEPTREVIQSGVCRVTVCTEFDFGNSSFRFYAPDRTSTIRSIPKGACSCEKIRRLQGRHINFDLETKDGSIVAGVNVLRGSPPESPRAKAADATTWEEYDRAKGDFDEVSDFRWKADTFSSFQVFRSRYSRRATRDYFLVPRLNEFRAGGQRQSIAFTPAFGFPIGESGTARFRAFAQVRLDPGVLMFQFFSPQLVPSDDWVTSMERSAEFVEQRLFVK